MSNITVKFIDREYSVPEDLLVYLDLPDLTNDVRMALNKSFYIHTANAKYEILCRLQRHALDTLRGKPLTAVQTGFIASLCCSISEPRL